MADQNKETLSETFKKIVTDFRNICRFCLAETKNGISINEKCLVERGDNTEQESVFNFVTKLRIIKMEGCENFPSEICKNCYEMINLFYNFAQLCQRSDTMLRNCYQNTLKEQSIPLILKQEEPKQATTEQTEKSALETYKQKLNLLSEKINDNNLELKEEAKNLSLHIGQRFRTVIKLQCKNCIKSFSDQEKLKRHYKMSHKMADLSDDWLNNQVKQLVEVRNKNFVCYNCVPYKQFATQERLTEHLGTCHDTPQQKDEKLFVCVKPSTTPVVGLGVLNSLNIAQKGSNVKVQCKNCDPPPVFSSVNEFVGHVCSQHDKQILENWTIEGKADEKDVKSWNCTECQASYSRKQSLSYHMREKHKQTNLGTMKCPDCSESFVTNRRLIQHGISVHQKYYAYFHEVFKRVLQPTGEEENREKNFECDICQRKYIYKTSLKKHILTSHLGKSGKDAVVCSYCGKTLSSKLNLKSHIEFVHEALFVSCPICKKKINFRTIGRHYKTHRTDSDLIFTKNSFLCNLCGKVLKSKRSFDDHQKLHKNIRDELCDICGSGFTTKKFLRLHKKIHEGAQRKVFGCDQCEKVFNGRHTLNRHLLTHSGKKNFICEICSKCFYTLQELNRHVRHHKKEYRFSCQLCDMRFLDKSRFRHHMMRHRNIRPHKCQFCDKMFIVRGKMNLHMTTKHNVEVQNTKGVWKDPKTYIPLDDLL